jgi:autotransporter translocation and assembly factor TamB
LDSPDQASAALPACDIPFSITESIPKPEGPGLSAVFELEGPGGRELSGTLVYPLYWSLSPPDIRARENGRLRLLASSSDLRLSDFDNLLPPRYGMTGTGSFNLTAKGPVADPKLEGVLSFNKMGLSTADGSRVSASGRIDLSGSRRSPALDGSIEIHNGLILIPDRPKELHPAEGVAILWDIERGETAGDSSASSPGGLEPGRQGTAAPAGSEIESQAVAAGDSAGGVSAVQTPSDTLGTPIALDVGVAIPAGLWIRGRGLEVEMAGDLRLIQKGGAPTVAGELRAVRGRLVFLGRQFAVERGDAVFYGGDEIDPSLDLVLATTVEDRIIRVLFQGTATKPELSLTSEPELTEGDIMSLLVFGRTTDELDNDQVDLLGSRAKDIAAAFGTSKLETKLAQQLGVDMVRIGKESGNGGGSSLIIGKYISPRVLLKYEQVLEERTRFFVNLEYFLTRHFKVETLIGHQSQSAVELNWTKDY